MDRIDAMFTILKKCNNKLNYLIYEMHVVYSETKTNTEFPIRLTQGESFYLNYCVIVTDLNNSERICNDLYQHTQIIA